MDVARIAYRGALGGAGELDLPDRGIVLITGRNGAGKSSFVEAVAVAAWGRTLRDSRPWRDGEAAAFDLVERTGLAVKRSRSKGGSQKLRFELAPGGASVEYETTAKAQAALDAQIGAFDLWRRANVFSGADAAHLSLATDAERKRLLEAMLGLEAFDQALLACKADVAAAQQEEALRRAEAAGARTSAERAEESFARAQRDLDALLEERPTFAPDDELAEELSCVWGLGGAAGARARLDEMAAEIADLARACGEDAATWQREAGALFSRASGLAAEARLEGARAKRLEDGACRECDQGVPAAKPRALFAKVERLGAKASAIEARAKSYDAEFAATRAEERSAKDRLYELRDRGKEILRVLQERDDHEAKLARSRSLIAGLESEAEMHHVGAGLADAKLAGVRLRVEELRAAADVLGLRGPRTTVLAGALGGITAGANDWLRRLGGGIQIELRPYTETRSGGTTGAIEIKVRGAGGGEGYKACSSGERRRIDVALLFGLGEVASAARGGRKSTMWCDEILTHLDEDGIAGAVEAIREVARERCVVVIEQERNIAVEMLRPDRVVRLRKG